MRALQTDLYELRMAASYLRRGMVEPATFSLFVRDLPADRGFLVAAGVGEALGLLEEFRFDAEDLDYLRRAVHLTDADLAAFSRLRFTGDVWAVPEGRVAFADEPLMEVTAPIAEAQLVETILLNTVTFQTTIASKAVRCRLAAAGAELIDFAYRRTQGIVSADTVARASAIAGFTATSNVTAARRYGLSPAGTMAHSYVEAFSSESEAFTAFATDFPDATVFLVDTYDTLDGVRHGIEVAKQLDLRGAIGIRLDSGDLASLAKAARRLLDAAGLRQARIVASGGLDEYMIAGLVAQGAPIDAYGVGTKMGVSADAPSLDSAYKLVAYGDRPVMKLSHRKATQPGAKQVYRNADASHGDLLTLRNEPAPQGWEPLLVPMMRVGRRLTITDPTMQIPQAARRLDGDLAWLPQPTRQISHPKPLPVQHSDQLSALHKQLSHTLAARLVP